MSVYTTADAHRDRVRQQISEAIKDLTAILIDECWGHDEYSEEYLQVLEQAFTDLREMKKKI